MSAQTRKRFVPKFDGEATLVPLRRVHTLDPSWPFSLWSTWKLVKTGRLGCKRVGQRYFLTRAHLDAFISGGGY
jgi:hypothetical protein